MTKAAHKSEILYTRVTKTNREYARDMKRYFKSESNYINRLITNDRIRHTMKNIRQEELAQLDKLENINNE